MRVAIVVIAEAAILVMGFPSPCLAENLPLAEPTNLVSDRSGSSAARTGKTAGCKEAADEGSQSNEIEAGQSFPKAKTAVARNAAGQFLVGGVEFIEPERVERFCDAIDREPDVSCCVKQVVMQNFNRQLAEDYQKRRWKRLLRNDLLFVDRKVIKKIEEIASSYGMVFK